MGVGSLSQESNMTFSRLKLLLLNMPLVFYACDRQALAASDGNAGSDKEGLNPFPLYLLAPNGRIILRQGL